MTSEPADEVTPVPERFDPTTMRGELVEAEHLARYWFASALAEGRTVLDAGCGLAYGSAALAEAGAARVVGVDIAQPVLDAAAAAMPPRVELLEADVRALPFEDGTFDLVVCFEVIEHVEEQERVLDELARVATDDAVVLVSSPNRDVYVPGNPHHIHEYLPDELRRAIGSRLANVVLARQHDTAASLVVTDAELDGRGREAFALGAAGSLLDLRPDGEPYTIAVASNRELPALSPLVCLGSMVEIRDWVARYAEQHEQLARQHEALREFDRLDVQRAQAVAELVVAEQANAELLDLRESLDELQTAYRRLLADVAALERDKVELAEERERVEAHLDKANAAIGDITTSASWRVTRPLRGAKRRTSGRRG